MKKAHITYLLIFFLLTGNSFGQSRLGKFDLSFNYSYTTTSKMFLNPNSPDDVIRTSYIELENIDSYSIELRYMLYESIAVGLSAEFMQRTDNNGSLNLGGLRAKLKDGFQFVPIEFSLYYYLPFSSDHFIFYMGGGAGLYFGKQIRNLGDVTIESRNKKLGAGIHVSVGMEYVIWNFISIRGQMRFRDPEFELENTYSNNFVNYEDKTFFLASDNFSSKVNVDGVTFTLGAVFRF